VSEIKKAPITVLEGDGWTNDSGHDATIFTTHSHRDILRYVISEIGEEVRLHVDDLLKEPAP
jgi:hypothetical protein